MRVRGRQWEAEGVRSSEGGLDVRTKGHPDQARHHPGARAGRTVSNEAQLWLQQPYQSLEIAMSRWEHDLFISLYFLTSFRVNTAVKREGWKKACTDVEYFMKTPSA